MDLIKTIEEQQKKPNAEYFSVGDTVKVHFEIIEGKTKRIQIYEGFVICFKNSGISKTFTVRKTSYGVGVERVFPLNSPRIIKVEIVRLGKVRRSKIYYVRDGWKSCKNQGASRTKGKRETCSSQGGKRSRRQKRSCNQRRAQGRRSRGIRSSKRKEIRFLRNPTFLQLNPGEDTFVSSLFLSMFIKLSKCPQQSTT